MDAQERERLTKILKKRKLTGYDTGFICLLNIAELMKDTKGEPYEAKITNSEYSKLVLRLTPEQREIHDRFFNCKQFLLEKYNYTISRINNVNYLYSILSARLQNLVDIEKLVNNNYCTPELKSEYKERTIKFFLQETYPNGLPNNKALHLRDTVKNYDEEGIRLLHKIDGYNEAVKTIAEYFKIEGLKIFQIKYASEYDEPVQVTDEEGNTFEYKEEPDYSFTDTRLELEECYGIDEKESEKLFECFKDFETKYEVKEENKKKIELALKELTAFDNLRNFNAFIELFY